MTDDEIELDRLVADIAQQRQKRGTSANTKDPSTPGKERSARAKAIKAKDPAVVPEIDRAIKVRRILDLRRAGASWRQIGEDIGMSHVTARDWYRAELEKVALTDTELRDYLAEQLDELETARLGIWADVINGNVKAVNAHGGIVDRRMKIVMIGRDAHTTSVFTDPAEVEREAVAEIERFLAGLEAEKR
jgi:hypothetical protein